MFYFHEFMEKIGLDPGRARLLRHDVRGLAAWRRGMQVFGCFASFQNRNSSPYAGCQYACHFVPGPTLADGATTGLFVGSTHVVDQWVWDGIRLPAIQDQTILDGEQGRQDLDAFDLEWIDEGHAFSERILIRFQFAHQRTCDCT